MSQEPLALRIGGRRVTDGVNVSSQQMYDLLLKIDRNLTQLTSTVGTQSSTLIDHETRLRAVAAAEPNGVRVAAVEGDVAAIREDLDGLKKKVYAIPSLSAAVAAAALVITLIRWL